LNGHTESRAEREQRVRERAAEARKHVSMTPGQAKTLLALRRRRRRFW
jgi:hypothetical protein